MSKVILYLPLLNSFHIWANGGQLVIKEVSRCPVLWNILNKELNGIMLTVSSTKKLNNEDSSFSMKPGFHK